MSIKKCNVRYWNYGGLWKRFRYIFLYYVHQLDAGGLFLFCKLYIIEGV